MRILLVDDLRLTAEHLAERLAREPEVSSVTVATNLQHVRDLRQGGDFDLGLVALGTPEARAVLDELAGGPGRIPVVVLGVSELGDEAILCAEAGAAGYLFRSESYVDLLQTVHSVCRGEAVCPPHVTAALLRRVAVLAQQRRPDPPAGQLTPREREVLGLVERGLANKQIARSLSIEIRTVKNHMHNILRKLDVSSRGEAVARIRQGYPSDVPLTAVNGHAVHKLPPPGSAVGQPSLNGERGGVGSRP